MNEVVSAPVKNKGGRPPKPIDVQAVLASPQGQAAIDAAVQAAMEKLTAQIGAARSGAEPIPGSDEDFLTRMARSIALSMAEVADQGTNRKRVAPEILAKRAEAHDRLLGLLAKAHADGFKPRYRVTSKVYLEEILVEPFRINAKKEVEPVEIGWSGMPNECMVPVDERTTTIFNAYMESIGGMTVMAKTHDGRAFIGDNRPVGVTPGGLVVAGLTNPRRQVSNLADSNNGRPSDLSLYGQNDPRATEVRVLGTVAPPAHQNGGQLSR